MAKPLCTTTRRRKVCRQSLRISGTAAALLAPFAMALQSCRASSIPRPANPSSTVRPLEHFAGDLVADDRQRKEQRWIGKQQLWRNQALQL